MIDYFEGLTPSGDPVSDVQRSYQDTVAAYRDLVGRVAR
jgi:hypothetical protein